MWIGHTICKGPSLHQIAFCLIRSDYRLSQPSMKRHVPNGLTIARMVLTPLALWIYVRATGPVGLDIVLPGLFGVLVVLLVAMAASDFLDGYLARIWNARTRLGAALDPLSDKVFVLLSLAVLIATLPLQGLAPWCWMLWGLLVVRDGLTSWWRWQGKLVGASTLSKWKTAMEMAFALFFLIGLPLLGELVLLDYGLVSARFTTIFAMLTALALWTARDYVMAQFKTPKGA
jgi:CDP-diacylglycerol--glycerol-3-phosphate 3-phosphatidyltransferase